MTVNNTVPRAATRIFRMSRSTAGFVRRSARKATRRYVRARIRVPVHQQCGGEVKEYRA
jgi:hypothetical protein